MASPATQAVLNDIKNNNLKSALVKLQAFTRKKEKSFAHYCALKQLNDYIYNNNKEVKKKDEEDVYNLSMACCSYLSENWDCKRTTFMQCLYHIQKSLINKNPLMSKNLCKYYFKLKKDLKIRKWDDKENVILSNVFQDFAFKTDIFGTDDKSVISWVSYLFKLLELQDYINLYRIFDALSFILSGIVSARGKDVGNEFGRLYLIELSNFLGRIDQFEAKDFDRFIYFIEFATYYSDRSAFLACFEPVLKCIQSINEIYPGHKCSPVEICIKLCTETDEKTCEILLKDLLDSIEKTEFVNVCKLVSNILYQFQSFFIKESPIVKTNFPTIIKLCSVLCGKLVNDLSSRRTPYFFVNIIHLSSFFVLSLNTKDDKFKETLNQIYPELKNLYSILTRESVRKHLNLDVPINSILNTVIAYKNLEMYKECAELCRILFKIILNYTTENARTKTAIVLTISILPSAYNEIGLYEEAQMALIALATVHKEYIEDVFKSWSDIKNKNIHNDKDSTVVSILNEKGDIIEKNYPPFKTADADVNMLLLHEVKSYTKHKDTRNCVLAVYRTAKKVVQDEKILTSILISTVDAITMQDTPKMSEFEQALYSCVENIKSELETGKDTSSLYLLLGNIYYQLVRCEILDLRKRTEQEVVRMNTKAKKHVLQGDEGDELDCTSFAPAYSYLQFDAQSFIFKNMEKSVSSWEKAIPNVKNDFVAERTLSYIKALGYLYRLYAFKSKELQIWELLFKFSSLLSNIKYKALAFAEILGIKRSVSDTSIENIKKEMEDGGINDKNYIKLLFNVNLAKYLYYNGKVDLCLQILENLNEELTKYFRLVQFQQIIINTIAKQTKEKRDEFHENVINPVVTILKQLLYLIKQGNWRSFSELCVIQWLLLECSEYLGTFYVNANYVREACCYTNSLLETAQRLALPLRVCKLLGILSHIDLNCNRNFECDIKLKGIETILDLKSVGDKENGENRNCASPCLIDKINSEPHFLTANDDCRCNYCSNIDYQIISLNTAILRGLNLVLNDSNKMASVVFKVGYEIMKYLSTKKSKDIFAPLEPIKIDYYSAVSTANAIWGKYDKALKYNSIAIDMCEKANFFYLFPKHILLCQKNNILWKQTYTIRKSIKVNPRKRMEDRRELVKTPENQRIPVRNEMRTRVKHQEPITPRPFFCKSNLDEGFHPIQFEEMSTPSVKKGQSHLVVPQPRFFKLNSVQKPKRTPLRLKEPSTSSVKKKNIKVFCDDEFATPLKTESKTRPPSTHRKRCEPLSPTFKIPEARQLVFEDSSDDEIQFIHRFGKNYTKKIHSTDSEPQTSKNTLDLPETSRPNTPKTPTSNDEASIIEGTPPRPGRQIVLTPKILSDKLSKLTLSTKASKKKDTDKPTEPAKRCLRARKLL